MVNANPTPLGELLPRLPQPALDRLVMATPDWKCYACHDSGLIVEAHLLIAGYDPGIDPPVLCRHCNAAAKFSDEVLRRLDNRATPEQCRYLHDLAYSYWRITLKNIQTP